LDRIIEKLKIQIQSREQGKSNRFIHFYSNYGGIYLTDSDKSKKQKLAEVLSKLKFVERVLACTSKNMPDIILILKKKFLYSVKSSFFKINHCYSFNHSDKGIFIAFGKNIKKGTKESVNYIDIAPTILDLLKIQKPKYMKGQTLNITS
jgi:predicted AlkP superfamily phosphohydrolase/phosphomutase